MLINELITLTRTAPESIEFTQVMELITDHYHYTPTAFSNGDLASEAGSNEGSCKIFYFAKLNQLSAEQTLSLFGAYYREDVLQHPQGTDHGNIRNFMVTGWDGIEFFSEALAPK